VIPYDKWSHERNRGFLTYMRYTNRRTLYVTILYLAKTRGMGLHYGENFIILTSTVFDSSTRVTDRQTERRAIAYSALSICAICCRAAHNVVRKTRCRAFEDSRPYCITVDNAEPDSQIEMVRHRDMAV